MISKELPALIFWDSNPVANNVKQSFYLELQNKTQQQPVLSASDALHLCRVILFANFPTQSESLGLTANILFLATFYHIPCLGRHKAIRFSESL